MIVEIMPGADYGGTWRGDVVPPTTATTISESPGGWRRNGIDRHEAPHVEVAGPPQMTRRLRLFRKCHGRRVCIGPAPSTRWAAIGDTYGHEEGVC